jgi:hypothetical protein
MADQAVPAAGPGEIRPASTGLRDRRPPDPGLGRLRPPDPGLGGLRPPGPGLGEIRSPNPGPGEITVTTPLGRPLCTSLDHRRAGTRAAVIATFGAATGRARGALFVGCWGRSYALCAQCWDDTRRAAQRHHPSVPIHDSTAPAQDDHGLPVGKPSERADPAR